MRSFVPDLARAEIGSTYNQYAASPLLCARLTAYLALRASAPILLVGEAAGYRGARVSGIPFTSERQLSGRRVVAVGRLAHAELGGPYVRHPSHGGARQFRSALVELLG